MLVMKDYVLTSYGVIVVAYFYGILDNTYCKDVLEDPCGFPGESL